MISESIWAEIPQSAEIFSDCSIQFHMRALHQRKSYKSYSFSVPTTGYLYPGQSHFKISLAGSKSMFLSHMAESSGVIFFNVDYRLAPEAKCPENVKDFYSALKYVVSHTCLLILLCEAV